MSATKNVDLFDCGLHQPTFTPETTPPPTPGSFPTTFVVRLAIVNACSPPKVTFATVRSDHDSFERIMYGTGTMVPPEGVDTRRGRGRR